MHRSTFLLIQPAATLILSVDWGLGGDYWKALPPNLPEILVRMLRVLGLTIGNSLPAWAALGIVIWISRKRNSRTPIEC